MHIIIAGGGKIGYYLSKTLLSFKHKVSVIERNEDLCVKLANELNIPVIKGDATNIAGLQDVGTDRADIFIAVTGRDEDNLIACQLAKRNFKVRRTIARVNNPKNIEVFERLGVDTAVSSTSIIADLIEQEVDYVGMKTLMKLRNGKVVLNEIQITGKSPVCNKRLKDINIPKDCIVISIIRDDGIIIPGEHTVIRDSDVIIAVSSEEAQQDLKDYFLGV